MLYSDIPFINLAYILKAISTKRNISFSWQPARNRSTRERRSCPEPPDLELVLANILLYKILKAETKHTLEIQIFKRNKRLFIDNRTVLFKQKSYILTSWRMVWVHYDVLFELIHFPCQFERPSVQFWKFYHQSNHTGVLCKKQNPYLYKTIIFYIILLLGSYAATSIIYHRYYFEFCY
jgi:hypothetical protein